MPMLSEEVEQELISSDDPARIAFKEICRIVSELDQTSRIAVLTTVLGYVACETGSRTAASMLAGNAILLMMDVINHEFPSEDEVGWQPEGAPAQAPAPA